MQMTKTEATLFPELTLPALVPNSYQSTPPTLNPSARLFPGERYKIPVLKVQMVKEGVISSEMASIGGPSDVYNLASLYLTGTDREHLLVFVLDTKNKLLAVNTVSVGLLDQSLIHPREVFKPAILAGAASIILSHNHPSGDPTPSAEDVAVSKRCILAGEIIGIDMVDHIIIGDGMFVSLKERGLI